MSPILTSLTLSVLLYLVTPVSALPTPPLDTSVIPAPPVIIPILRRYIDNTTHSQNAKYIARKYDSLLENYERNAGHPYVGTMPTTERRALAKREGSTGSLTAVLNGDVPLLYYAKMQIGTPPVEIRVDLDTGSADLWVKSSLCTGKCDGTKYNPSQSSTTNGPLSSDWSIGYADSSSASGSLYQDTITLAGQTVTDQCVAVVSNSVIDTDGLMGMGLAGIGSSSWKAASATTFFETLVSQQGRSLPSKVFSFALTSSGGRLVLGGVGSNVESSGKPPIKWCDVIQPAGFWSIAVDSFKSSKSDNELGQGKTIAIDTGTTGIIMDISTVQAFFSDPAAVDLHALDSNKWDLGKYAVPCDGSYTGTFVFGGNSFTLNGKNILSSQVPEATKAKGVDYCESLLYYIDIGIWIAGDAFMRQFYVAFDATDGKERVGFSPLASS